MVVSVSKLFGGGVMALSFAVHTCHAGFDTGLIDVDIDPRQPPTVYTGAAVIGNPGDFWNESPVFTLSPVSLFLVDGSPSSVNLELPIHDATFGQYGAAGFYGGSYPMAVGSYGALLGDGLGSEITLLPTVLTLTGLSPGATYELFAYSYLNTTGETIFDVAGSSATVIYQSLSLIHI